MDSLLIKVTTDSGLVGWGDAFGVRIWPVTQSLFNSLIKPLCIGADPLQRNELIDTLWRTLYHFGRGGPLQFALSGLEIALWDIAAKAANVPVHELIGPCLHTTVPVYASLLPYRDAALAARFSAQAVDEGYRYVKLHERDVASVAQSRAAIGDDVGLMVDVNCAFDLAGAKQFADDISQYKPMWIEEPIFAPDDYEGIQELSRHIDVPLALGENVGTTIEFERLLKHANIAYAQPSAIKTGGIAALLQVAKAAAQHNAMLMPHSADLGPGLLATLHTLSTIEGSPIIERFYCKLAAEPCGEVAKVTGGFMQVPQGPGLGFEPDPALLKKYAA
jgi:L-alanine-DL-glutamate epimerase-like enolase superfamily enzyme